MGSGSKKANNAAEIDRLALAFARDPGSKAFIPLAEEYGKAAMWEEAAAVLEDGLKTYPGFITAMVALGRAYDQMNQPVKAQAILEEAIKLSPDNLRAHRTLAKLYAAQGAKNAAIQSCNVILALNPQDQEALALRVGLDVPMVQGVGDAVEPAGGKRTSSGVSHSSDRASRASSISSTMFVKTDEADRLPGVEAPLENNTTDSDSSKTPGVGEPAKGRNPVVLQLEQWLRSIHVRRRDSQSFSQSSPNTST